MYNQKSDLLSVDTTIVKSEDKGTQVLVTDSNNNYYSFFKTKQDGSPTAASNTFSLASNGQPVSIVYKEVPYKGKTLRSVVKFRAQEAGRPSPAQPPRTPQYEQRSAGASVTPSTQDGFGKRLAIHGFINGMLANGAQPALITSDTLQELDALEARVTNFLERGNGHVHASGNVAPANPTSDEDINVEDIPF